MLPSSLFAAEIALGNIAAWHASVGVQVYPDAFPTLHGLCPVDAFLQTRFFFGIRARKTEKKYPRLEHDLRVPNSCPSLLGTFYFALESVFRRGARISRQTLRTRAGQLDVFVPKQRGVSLFQDLKNIGLRTLPILSIFYPTTCRLPHTHSTRDSSTSILGDAAMTEGCLHQL